MSISLAASKNAAKRKKTSFFGGEILYLVTIFYLNLSINNLFFFSKSEKNNTSWRCGF